MTFMISKKNKELYQKSIEQIRFLCETYYEHHYTKQYLETGLLNKMEKIDLFLEEAELFIIVKVFKNDAAEYNKIFKTLDKKLFFGVVLRTAYLITKDIFFLERLQDLFPESSILSNRLQIEK